MVMKLDLSDLIRFQKTDWINGEKWIYIRFKDCFYLIPDNIYLDFDDWVGS